MNDVEKQIAQKLIGNIPGCADICDILPMTPDVSPRRYYRIFLSDSRTLILVIYDGLDPYEITKERDMPPDISFLNLSHFFAKNGIPVPETLAGDTKNHFYVLSDVGDRTLGSCLDDDTLSEEIIEKLFNSAVDILSSIVKIEKSSDSEICFCRFFSSELFSKELGEFLEFVDSEFPDDEEVKSQARQLAKMIIDLIAKHPVVLAHRDYHSWNIVVSKDEKLSIVDFQDALMAPRAYDIASLLNDRDTDVMLGKQLQSRLLKRYITKVGFEDKFEKEYEEILLQRNLKIVGRFWRIVRFQGRLDYQQWIPGALSKSCDVIDARFSKDFVKLSKVLRNYG